MPTIVKFNRKYTDTQLAAAVGTSTIGSAAVVNGTVYIASNGNGIYIGDASTPNSILRLVGDTAGSSTTGSSIVDKINTEFFDNQGSWTGGNAALGTSGYTGDWNTLGSASDYSSGQVVAAAQVAVMDAEGNVIHTSYKPIQTAVSDPSASSTTTTTFIDTISQNSQGVITATKKTLPAYKAVQNAVTPDASTTNGTTAGQYVEQVTQNSQGVITVTRKKLNFKEIQTAVGTQTATQDLNYQDPVVADITQDSQGVITVSRKKLPTAASFSLQTMSSQVKGGAKLGDGLKMTGEVLSVDVETSIGSTASNIKAPSSLAVYNLFTGLGTVLFFAGTETSVANIKAKTNQKKGAVWLCSADGSEWVATDDIGSTSDASKWQEFGHAYVDNPIYKGTGTYSSQGILVADGTAGAVKTDTIANLGNGVFKPVQTAVADSGTGYVSAVTQDTAGVITVTKTALPSGSGSVGTSSSATDAWKTVVHDVSLSDHTLGGNTKSIPAADGTNLGSDGYMTAAQAVKLAGIDGGAQVNQNAFATVNDEASGSFSASSTQDSFSIVGDNYYTATAVDVGGGNSISVLSKNIVYGSSSTSAATAQKDVTVSAGSLVLSNNVPMNGTIVLVNFSNANTATQPTLKVGSDSARSISIQGTTVNSTNGGGELIKGICMFCFNGSTWGLIGIDRGSTTSFTTSAVTDAWKTPVVSTSLSVDHVLSGTTQAIPAAVSANSLASSSDGYMTAQEAYDLYLAKTNSNTAVLALTWEE